MTPHENDPERRSDPKRPAPPVAPASDPTGPDPVDDAPDVRRMLQERSRAVMPHGTFADVQARIDADVAVRRRNRTLLSAAAAVALVVLVAGVVTLTGRDRDGTEQVDTADSSTSVSPTSEPATTTTRDGAGSSTTEPTPETSDATSPTTTTAGTGPTEPDDPETTGDPPSAAQPISARTPVRIDGIGPISVPVPVTEAAAVTGQPISIDPGSVIDESNPCRFAQDPSLPGIWYMVEGDRIVRVDITGSGTPNPTDAGVGVGSTTADVLAAYPGRVTEEPHPYAMDEDSRYLVVTDPGHPDHSIIFSVHQGAVQDYRVGLTEFVRYPEGCA